MLLGLVRGDDLMVLFCQFGCHLINMGCRYIRLKAKGDVHVSGVGQ